MLWILNAYEVPRVAGGEVVRREFEAITIMLGWEILRRCPLACGYAAPHGLEGAPKLG